MLKPVDKFVITCCKLDKQRPHREMEALDIDAKSEVESEAEKRLFMSDRYTALRLAIGAVWLVPRGHPPTKSDQSII